MDKITTGTHTRVILAASLGTAFEWYDFYLYGALAAVISKQFFAGANESSAFIFALLTFAVGFAVRPFGAMVFGRLGDLVGRKRTFLITIVVMGSATALVGVLPNYEHIGLAAPIVLVLLRSAQGLALGGEYGGAAIYVAEHAPPNRRALYTSFIQLTATFGLALSLVVILMARGLTGAEFGSWGWRIPFLVSLPLLLISVYIRLKLHESPVFQQMVREGTRSRAPVKESFGEWRNFRTVLIALLGGCAGMTVVFYCGQIYSLLFLSQVLKVDAQSANLLIAAALIVGSPCYVFSGWLADRIGAKTVVISGCLLAAATYFPIFHAITHYANPAIEEAAERAPVTVIANPSECSVQFDLIGSKRFTKSCDVAKSALARAGVPYTNEAAPYGALALVRIGAATQSAGRLSAFEGTGLSAADFKAADAAFVARLSRALKSAGYPASADPARINYSMVFLLLLVLVLCLAVAYGPVAALLVDLFPARIRYTSLSVAYHSAVGTFGGFLPTIAFALVAITGNLYAGLWYPIIVATASALTGALFLRRSTPTLEPAHAPAAGL